MSLPVTGLDSRAVRNIARNRVLWLTGKRVTSAIYTFIADESKWNNKLHLGGGRMKIRVNQKRNPHYCGSGWSGNAGIYLDDTESCINHLSRT